MFVCRKQLFVVNSDTRAILNWKLLISCRAILPSNILVILCKKTNVVFALGGKACDDILVLPYTTGGRRGVVVTRLIQSTKLLYAGPG